jgi:hypothetical protein
MTQRKTPAQLKSLADRANRLTGSPASYWATDPTDPKRETAKGHFTIEGRNGGYALARVANTAGATDDITPTLPMSQAYAAINAFLTGIVIGLQSDRAYTR